jgi:hypothetical protein
MRAILTDEINNDLFLNADKNIAFTSNDNKVIRKLVQNKLQTFLGEVFTDLDLGVGYFGIILPDSPLSSKIEEFKRNILDVPYFKDITNVSFKQNKTAGTITFEMDLLTTKGDVVNLNDLIIGV